MVKHIILWKLKDTLSSSEKQTVCEQAKVQLESLKGKINGLSSINVQIDRLPTSTADMMLDCTFTDEAALKAYAQHPAHVAVANTYVRPFTAERFCLDFETPD